jgi:hypothetical protein
MANTTGRLLLPYILQSQSQKEVTYNDALNRLDILTQAVAQDVGTNTPPGSPTVGQCWIIGSSPTGAWAGKANYIAQADGAGGWYFVAPIKRARFWIESLQLDYIYDGTAWMPVGLIMKDTGEYLRVEQKSEDLTTSSGATKDSTIFIPDRAILLCVNVRVLTAVTGATSFGVGIVGDTTKFGNFIGIAVDSTNIGVIGPTAFYANTTLRLTANGANFSGGVVRATMQYLKPRGPWTW